MDMMASFWSLSTYTGSQLFQEKNIRSKETDLKQQDRTITYLNATISGHENTIDLLNHNNELQKKDIDEKSILNKQFIRTLNTLTLCMPNIFNLSVHVSSTHFFVSTASHSAEYMYIILQRSLVTPVILQWLQLTPLPLPPQFCNHSQSYVM